MRFFELSQRLMGRCAVVSVRLDGVAEFDESVLRGKDQMRIVALRSAAQKIADLIGRAGGGRGEGFGPRLRRRRGGGR